MPMGTRDLLIFASGEGNTMRSVLEAKQRVEFEPRIVGMITDREDAGCIDVAKEFGLNHRVIREQAGMSRAQYCKILGRTAWSLGALPPSSVLAFLGFNKIVSEEFSNTWDIVNVHPSLLPKHRGSGKNALAATLASGDTIAGTTFHRVDKDVDNGKILFQRECPVEKDDTVETLWARIKTIEKQWAPHVLAAVCAGKNPDQM